VIDAPTTATTKLAHPRHSPQVRAQVIHRRQTRELVRIRCQVPVPAHSYEFVRVRTRTDSGTLHRWLTIRGGHAHIVPSRAPRLLPRAARVGLPGRLDDAAGRRDDGTEHRGLKAPTRGVICCCARQTPAVRQTPPDHGGWRPTVFVGTPGGAPCRLISVVGIMRDASAGRRICCCIFFCPSGRTTDVGHAGDALALAGRTGRHAGGSPHRICWPPTSTWAATHQRPGA
jgi:hypothetical protein